MDELKTSIREFGLLQPVVVRETGPGAYELVMGERRWRASRDLGLTTIPAIVRDTADDAMLRDALLENLHRAQLNPLEEAAAYQQLLDEFGTTHEELASRIGRSRSAGHATRSGCSTCRCRCSAGSPPACCPRATPGRCSRWTTPTRRTRWPPGSSPRACRCGRSRSSSRSPGTRSRPPAGRADRAASRAPALDRPRRPALRQLRHPGQGRARPAQGQDRRRVRLGRRPGADRRAHGPRHRPASERSRRPGRVSRRTSSRCPRRTCTSTWRARSGRPRWPRSARSRRSRPSFAGFGRVRRLQRGGPEPACGGRRLRADRVRVLRGLGRRRRPVRGGDVHRGRARGPARRLGAAAGGGAGRAAGGVARGGHRGPGADRPLPPAAAGLGARSRCGWRRRTPIWSSGSVSPGTRPRRSSPYAGGGGAGRRGRRAPGAPRRGDRRCGERAGGARRRPGRADRPRHPVAGGSRAGRAAAGRAGSAGGLPVLERGPRAGALARRAPAAGAGRGGPGRHRSTPTSRRSPAGRCRPSTPRSGRPSAAPTRSWPRSPGPRSTPASPTRRPRPTPRDITAWLDRLSDHLVRSGRAGGSAC